MPVVEEWIYKVPTQQLGHKGKDYIDSLNDHCFSNHFPDIVMKMNRYRMNRSEKDLLAKNLPANEVTGENFMIGVVGGGLSPVNSKDMKSDGADTKPLDYRCGFDGDEELSNDETVGWGGSSSTYLQGDSTAYNFLNGLIAYSLLPTAAADKRDSVKTYGEWMNGPFHTQRLQTRDPLFGDLFGFNRWEYCASGDCNSMRGPIAPWARIGVHDAFSALRRACLSFQLDGPVYPVRLNNPDSENLIIKAVTGMFEWTPVTELAVVNQDGKEHLLDITLYVGHNNPVEAHIFDDKAARKHDAQRVMFTPVNGEINYKTAVPALRAWQLIIFNKEGDVSAWTGAPSVPLATAPLRDADLTQQPVVLKWQLSPSSNNCVIQLAKEAIFSDKHIVKEEIITGQEYTVPSELLKDKTRLWWRVRAVNKNGVGSAWSVPRPFCYQWPERAKLMKEMGENKKRLNDAEDNVWLKTNIRERELGLDKDRNNAVSRATLVTSNAVYPGPPSGAAVDFSFESVWTAPLPATWTLIWDKPETVHNIRIYWHEKMIGNNYRILGKVDEKWLELLNVKGNTQTDARHELEKPVSIFQLQLEIQSASDEQGKTVKYGKITNQPGIRELRVD